MVPPPPGESQDTEGTDTSRTLLSPKTMKDDALNIGELYNNDTEFNPIAKGTRTTPLHLAVPLKVVTPPVPVRIFFSDLENDAALEESLPPDSKMTPLLSRVLNDIPPPDVDDATAGRIVDSFRHTACVADNVLQSMRPRRTLADALAKLDKVEAYVIETTDWIASSMARLTSSNNMMSG